MSVLEPSRARWPLTALVALQGMSQSYRIRCGGGRVGQGARGRTRRPGEHLARRDLSASSQLAASAMASCVRNDAIGHAASVRGSNGARSRLGWGDSTTVRVPVAPIAAPEPSPPVGVQRSRAAQNSSVSLKQSLGVALERVCERGAPAFEATCAAFFVLQLISLFKAAQQCSNADAKRFIQLFYTRLNRARPP